ncbi:MAG: YfgM family protein [Formosimonas sp.]
MAYDLDEQEQLENFKAFWERWGKWIQTVVLLAVIGILAWKGYEYYQVKQSEKASQAYEAYVNAMQKKDAGADALLAALQKDYTTSRYATLGSLDAAQTALTAQKWDVAQQQLQWILDHSTVENQGVARLHMADVLVQKGQYDAALKTLDVLPAPEFAAAFANKKADVYLLMNDAAKARASVEAAIAAVQKQTVKDEPLEQALKQKLEFLPQ